MSISPISSICPLCQTSVMMHADRYPNAICNDCITYAVDSKGNRVVYKNGMSGFGFESHHFSSRTNKIKYIKNDPVCFIQNRECIAEESRFGGIVVQLKI